MASRSISMPRIPLALTIALIVILAIGGGQPAHAAEIAVNTTDDELNSDGDCSLREAIRAANTDAPVDACAAGSGADAISLPASVTPYTLSIGGTGEDAAATGDLDITDDLTIIGTGAISTIIDGGAIEHVFHVDPLHTGVTAQISGVTIQNGSTTISGGGINVGGNGTLVLSDSTLRNNTTTTSHGGAIQNLGTATLTNVTISGNSAPSGFGGGIDNRGNATLINVVISGNTAAGGAGGIHNFSGTLTLVNSTVDTNTASGNGGGIYNTSSLTITNTTISGNTASGDGGGIRNDGTSADIKSTTISGNSSDSGGGIGNHSTLTLTNSTISGNSATSYGGGLGNFGGTAVLMNVTINGNSAGTGGGIAAFGTQTLQNTLVANSSSGGDCANPVTSSGHNLDSDGSCSLNQIGDLPSTDPKLGALADNGGTTFTHALLPGSPAIDAGNNLACPPTDQRGVVRPADGNRDGTATCDIGAFEALSIKGDVDCDGDVDAVDALFVLRYVAGLGPFANCLEAAGNIDCDNNIDAVDALLILRYVAGLPLNLPQACPSPG